MRRFVPPIFKITLFLFLLWSGGFGLFFISIPQRVTDQQTPTEAIVVLTGGRERRVKTGFQLLCAQRAKVIFISGVHPEETLKSLLKGSEMPEVVCHLNREQLASSTYLGYAAKNTKENAEEIARWTQQIPITSLRLVTAAYHMPRSLMELKNLLPQTTIIPHPVFPSRPKPSKWRKGEGTLYLIFSEYHKFLWGFIRIRFSGFKRSLFYPDPYNPSYSTRRM